MKNCHSRQERIIVDNNISVRPQPCRLSVARGHAACHGFNLLREPGHSVVRPTTVAEVNGGQKVSGWRGAATCILGGRFVVRGVFGVKGEARARGGMDGGRCGG